MPQRYLPRRQVSPKACPQEWISTAAWTCGASRGVSWAVDISGSRQMAQFSAAWGRHPTIPCSKNSFFDRKEIMVVSVFVGTLRVVRREVQ